MELYPDNSKARELVSILKSASECEIDNFLINLIKDKLIQESDIQELYEFFSYIYDNLYHDILFERIPVSKNIIHILETLSIPNYDESEIEKILSGL